MALQAYSELQIYFTRALYLYYHPFDLIHKLIQEKRAIQRLK